MLWLQLLSKFVRLLREGASPAAIAGGFTLGFFVGLTPFLTLQNVLLILVVAVLRLNFAAFGLAYLLFSFFAYLFDPWFHSLGFFVLRLPALQPLFTKLYNLPIAPLTRFYNTLVMGTTIAGLVLAPGIFWLVKAGITAYRSSWAEKLENSKLMRGAKGLKVVQWYFKIRDFQGA